MADEIIKTESAADWYGDWYHIAGAIRATKQLIEDSQEYRGSLFGPSSGEAKLEQRILESYLVPEEGESFVDYQQRFNQTLYGSGFKGKIAKLLGRKKVGFIFDLTPNVGPSSLIVSFKAVQYSQYQVTKEEVYKYQITIRANGDYCERGKKIAQGLAEHIKQNTGLEDNFYRPSSHFVEF